MCSYIELESECLHDVHRKVVLHFAISANSLSSKDWQMPELKNAIFSPVELAEGIVGSVLTGYSPFMKPLWQK